MNRTKASLLFHPLFLLSLFILLCNDFYGKNEYHNWLTGKLSDIAGMIVLPVICRVFFPTVPQKRILVICAVFFLWWKSPLSEPFLFFLNQSFQWPVQRVVDYSDWLCLFALPFATRIKPVSLPIYRPVVLCLQGMLAFCTFFALCATSMPYRSLFMAHPNSKEVYFHETFKQKRSVADVLQTLEKKGIAYHPDSVMYYPVLNQRQLYYRRPGATDSAYVWQQLSQAPDSTLYIKREGNPYYIIPAYQTIGEANTLVFRNIRFTLSENKKGTKTSITVEAFESTNVRPDSIMNKQERKKYEEAFRTLFSE